jgi:hypothetical protein
VIDAVFIFFNNAEIVCVIVEENEMRSASSMNEKYMRCVHNTDIDLNLG